MAVPQEIDPADWITIWQSELAALAVDQESHERLVSAAQGWDAVGDAAAAGRTGPNAPPGSAPAGAASGVGEELERLRRRVADLERATP